METITTPAIIVKTTCNDAKVFATYLPEEEAFVHEGVLISLASFFEQQCMKQTDTPTFQACLRIYDFRRLYEEAISRVIPIYEEGDTVWRKEYRGNSSYGYRTFLAGPIVAFRKRACSIHGDANGGVVAIRRFTDIATGEATNRPEDDMNPMGDLAKSKALTKVITRLKRELGEEGLRGIQIAAAGDIFAL